MSKSLLDSSSKLHGDLACGSAEQALRERELWLAGQKQAFQAAMNGQPLSISLGILVNTIITQTNGEARAAFYMVSAEEDGLHLVAGMTDEYAKDINGFKVGPESLACGLAVYTGKQVITRNVELELRWTPFLEIARKYNYMGCWSFPVRTEGGPILGTLAMYFEEPHDPKPEELEMAEILAHAAAVIISLHNESAERANAEKTLRKNEVRQAYLLKLSDALRPLGDPAAIQLAAMRILGEHLQITRSQFYEAELNDEYLISAGGYTNGVEPVTQRVRMDDFGTYIKETLRAGHTLAVANVAKDPRVSSLELKAYDQLSFRAFVGIPLIKDGRFVAGLGLHNVTAREWSAEDLAVAEETAERTWAAVERAKAEEALRENEEKYRTLFNSMDEGVVTLELIFDEHGKVTGFIYLEHNFAITRQTGLTSDIVGKKVSTIFPDLEVYWLEAYGRVAQTGKSERHEYYFVTLDNWFDIYISCVGQAGGNKVVCVYNNVTERKKAEEILRENEQKLKEFNSTLEQEVKKRTAQLQENHRLLQSIYNTTHVGMSVFKPIYNVQDKITDFEVIMVNKRVEDTSGRKDLAGKLYSKEFPGVKKMGLFDAMVKTMETGEPGHIEYFYEHEGIDRWYSTMCVRNDNMLVCSNLDLTEQKLAEEKNTEFALHQKEVEEWQQQQIFKTILDTQEEERRRIAENLHNSLGQILYGAKLNLGQVLKIELKDNDKQSLVNADKLLSAAITESRRMSHELMPVILEDFGLKAAVEDICCKFSDEIKFTCRFSGMNKRLDKYIEIAIYRIVQELMMNIVKHSGASEALISVEFKKAHILVLMQDNGNGFNNQTKKGDGIGLKTIRNKVSLLKGSINIISTPGKGVVTNIDIPVKN